MKALFAIAMLLLVTACGKKEAPSSTEQGKLPRGCDRVQILRIDTDSEGQHTLMETQDAHHFRFLRDGNFGNVGEVFSFCHGH